VTQPSDSSNTQPYVVFLVKRFPRLSETFVLNEFLELRRHGVAVRLFAIMDPGERQSQPEALDLLPEVTYLRQRGWPAAVPAMLRSVCRHPGGTLSALQWVLPRRRLASWRRLGEALILVDAVHGRRVHLHAHWANTPGAVAFLVHRIAGIPWSLSTHAKDLYTVKPKDLAERAAQCRFVTTCTAANGRYLAEVVGADPSKVVVARHGVRLDRFSVTGRDPEPGRLLSVGRLVPKKGFGTLIEACGLLADRAVPFHLDLVGDGPLAGHLRAKAAAERVGDRVTFHPARTQSELVEFYRRAGVFALVPAIQSDGDRDGVPNVILEAMACGVPVVASAISGIPEVVDDGRTGLLVPPDDPVALADAIERLLADPRASNALARRAAAAVQQSFDPASCIAPIVARLEESLRARHPAPPQAAVA
jgi:glycosyltransferase involved in cell wall biosynthesis